MSLNKKYFWLKLQKKFFTDKKVKVLRNIAGGDTYTIIYLKLLIESLENDCTIVIDNICEDVFTELELIIDENRENIKVCLMWLQKLGLCTFNENIIFFSDIESMVGKGSTEADRVRNYREKQKLVKNETSGCTNVPQVYTERTSMYEKRTPEIEKEKEKEIEKEKEEPHPPIDNSYYDITTNTYTNVKPKTKNEYEDFELLFIQAFNTLTVSACSELFQLTGFRAEDKRQRLKEIFNMRKYDYKKCINKAISEAQKTPVNKRWFNFLDFLKDYLINGYNGIVESNLQPSHSKSYDELLREEAESKAKKQAELENEAKSKGITVAELEAEHEKEIDKGIDNIKNMLGFGNLSEAIEHSNIGIKELPKGKEYKPAPYVPKELSKEDETQIQDLIKKARENSKHNKS